jgi:hypothetical protein
LCQADPEKNNGSSLRKYETMEPDIRERYPLSTLVSVSIFSLQPKWKGNSKERQKRSTCFSLFCYSWKKIDANKSHIQSLWAPHNKNKDPYLRIQKKISKKKNNCHLSVHVDETASIKEEKRRCCCVIDRRRNAGITLKKNCYLVVLSSVCKYMASILM